MKILKNLAIVALLSTFALSCENSSPAPQSVVLTPKPVEPTVLPNEKCYKGVVIHQICGAIVVQILNDSIGIRSRVSCLGIYDNVLTLDAPNQKTFEEFIKVKELYFTVSQFITITNGDFSNTNFNTVSACALPGEYALCSDGSGYNRYVVPNKYAKVSSYSYKSCESGK
jgi:hypothetical protein